MMKDLLLRDIFSQQSLNSSGSQPDLPNMNMDLDFEPRPEFALLTANFKDKKSKFKLEAEKDTVKQVLVSLITATLDPDLRNEATAFMSMYSSICSRSQKTCPRISGC